MKFLHLPSMIEAFLHLLQSVNILNDLRGDCTLLLLQAFVTFEGLSPIQRHQDQHAQFTLQRTKNFLLFTPRAYLRVCLLLLTDHRPIIRSQCGTMDREQQKETQCGGHVDSRRSNQSMTRSKINVGTCHEMKGS